MHSKHSPGNTAYLSSSFSEIRIPLSVQHILLPSFPYPSLPYTIFLVLSYQGLVLQSIKTYLSAVKHMHVLHGHAPLPAKPRFQMVLNGAQRLQPVLENRAPRNPLPITPTILGQLHGIWVSHQDRVYGAMIWAAASTCFFGFF